MSIAIVDTGFDGFQLPLQYGCGPYEPSVSSSLPSSQYSVCSSAISVQSSIASSISDDFRLSQEEYRDRCTQASIEQQAKAGHAVTQQQANLQCSTSGQDAKHALSSADVPFVPSEQRQHPRRSSLAKNQKPPPLTRQCDRKHNFVDNLVDSATQMVEVIWPCSVVPCKGEGSGGRGVLPLRTYIEETLRRSRTSYSTLQVALYYLILIKPSIPTLDFTMEQSTDCPANRALMCGRRMFLAALILASKYLQDRNYSAKAWSKMSGLKVCEINTNERIFLKEVSWKLHIPESIFRRWTDIVLKYTPSPNPPSPGQNPLSTWRCIIPLLTPELEKVPLPQSKQLHNGVSQPASALRCPVQAEFTSPMTTPTPTKSSFHLTRIDSTSYEGTPTPRTVLPRFLEPKPDLQPPTPALARMGPLPTPQMTPSSIASSTPAASVCGSRRPSMCSALRVVERAGLNRCSIDVFPSSQSASRRQSISAASSGSSPESLMSDRSRSSRASSISSISTVSSTSSMAPIARACLARQATCRNVRLSFPAVVKEEQEGSAAKPIIINDESEVMCLSPEVMDFSVSEKALHAPHKHSKHTPHHFLPSAPPSDKGRKRARPRGGRRTGLQEEVRMILEEEFDALDMDVDEDSDSASPTPAAEYASEMLSRSTSSACLKDSQPPASFIRRESLRVSVQKNEGKKRTCCSAAAISLSPFASIVYGEA